MAVGRFLCVLLLCTLQLVRGQSNYTTKHCDDDCQQEDLFCRMPFVMDLKLKDHAICVHEHRCPLVVQSSGPIPCTRGMAGEYECSDVDLLSFVSLRDLGSNGDGNDIWGWTDPDTGREYAIVGCADGSSFVDVSEPTSPQVLGFLPTHTTSSLWRDMKVYENHAFIISEARDHGMQVFDLLQLRNMKPTPQGPAILEETAFYGEFGNAHNIVSNEDTGYMYVVGTRTCRSGLHVVNVRDPTNPQFAGCFGDDGYVHDAQCVIYSGPDTRYSGNEICFCYNEDTLTLVDVTDKDAMTMISRIPYNNAFYTHQGWLLDDQSHLLLNDELDELYGPSPYTRSLIWNVNSLDKPILIGDFFSSKQATDHNLYIRDNLAYETNYCAGLRVLDVSEMKQGRISEVGYFDVAPDCNSPGFRGSWSSYPYFKSKTIIVNSIERGLFVLKYTGES